MKRQNAVVAIAALLVSACAGSPNADEEFAALQERGAAAMGVDQYTSTHVFESLPDGGRIELQMDVDDAAAVARIRAHLQDIRQAFSEGNFEIPMFVHDRPVPGTGAMAAARQSIRYEYRELARGGEVRMQTSDAEAVKAIHEFLAFQRGDHREGHAHD